MKVFNYTQYIKCIHTLRLNAVLQIAEEKEEYKLEKPRKQHINNASIKEILKNPKEAEEFINQFLHPQMPVKSEELALYKNNYIAKKYESKNADLIYKVKNQDIIYLIEHQSTIDNNMQYRMLNYCIDIMQECTRNRMTGKNNKYPTVVPVVIYTGRQKWNIPKINKDKPKNRYVLDRYKIDMEYNFIDINKIPKQVFMQKNTMLNQCLLSIKERNEEVKI